MHKKLIKKNSGKSAVPYYQFGGEFSSLLSGFSGMMGPASSLGGNNNMSGNSFGDFGSLLGAGSNKNGSMSKTQKGQAINQAIGSGLGVAFNAVNTFDNIYSNKNLNGDQKKIATGDAVVDTASQVAGMFGPVGSAIGAGLGLINKLGGSLIKTPKAIKDFKVNDDVASSSAFTGAGDMATQTGNSAESYKNAGLVGKLFGGKQNLISKANQANDMQRQVGRQLDFNKTRKDAALASSSMFGMNNTMKLNSGNVWTNGSVQFGKDGAKLVIKKQTGGILPVGSNANNIKYSNSVVSKPNEKVLFKSKYGFEVTQSQLDRAKANGLEFQNAQQLGEYNDSLEDRGVHMAAPPQSESIRYGRSFGTQGQPNYRPQPSMTQDEWNYLQKSNFIPNTFNSATYANQPLDTNKYPQNAPYNNGQGFYMTENQDKVTQYLDQYRQLKQPSLQFIASTKPKMSKGGKLSDIAKASKSLNARILVKKYFNTNINEESLVDEYVAIDDQIESFKNGGAINIIVDGSLHAHKHNLKNTEEFKDAEITIKGVPVVSKAEGGEIIQHAEVEKDELILHYDLTKTIESLMKEGSEEAAIQAGRILSKEIVKNTKDSSNKILKHA